VAEEGQDSCVVALHVGFEGFRFVGVALGCLLGLLFFFFFFWGFFWHSLVTSCVLGLRPFALLICNITYIKKKNLFVFLGFSSRVLRFSV
jgi:hypothetical protein